MSEELFNTYPDLKRLQRRIRRSEGIFSLFFAECNLPTLRLELAEALSEKLQQEALFIELPLPQGQPIPFDEIIAEQVAETTNNQAIFLFGLENWLPTSDQETLNQTTQQINWRRSAFARLNRPLVIWLPKYAVDLLAEYTPDFYDWYSGFFSFKAESDHITNYIESSLEDYHACHSINFEGRLSKPETIRWIHTLRSLLEENKDKVERGRLLNLLGMSHQKLGEYEVALSCFKKALNIQKETNDLVGESSSLTNIGTLALYKGHYELALGHLQQALKLHQKIGNKAGEGSALNNISKVHHAFGDLDKALQYLKQALHNRKTIGNKSGEGTTLNNIAHIYAEKGDNKSALTYLEKALLIHQEIGNQVGEASTLHNISHIYKSTGNYKASMEYLEKSLSIAQTIGDKANEGAILNSVGALEVKLGNLQAAKNHLLQAFVITQKLGDTAGLCGTLSNLGYILYQGEDPKKALELWTIVYLLSKHTHNNKAIKVSEKLSKQLSPEGSQQIWKEYAKHFNLDSKSIDQLVSEITI